MVQSQLDGIYIVTSITTNMHGMVKSSKVETREKIRLGTLCMCA